MVDIVPSKLCVCARTQVVRQAHTRKFSVHINVPSKNVPCSHFIHVIPNSDEFRLKREILCTHRLKQIRGNIGVSKSWPGSIE